MKKRIKVALATINSRNEAEAMMTELATSVNGQREITALRDAEILRLNEFFAPQLASHAVAIQTRTDALRVWLETHPEELPKGRKSLELTSGILGFRTGTPKLALLSRAFNWERVLSLVAQICPHYVRAKQEVDKDAMLGDYSTSTAREVTADKFRRVGVKVVQDETFFIEPKLTEVADRQVQTTEAA